MVVFCPSVLSERVQLQAVLDWGRKPGTIAVVLITGWIFVYMKMRPWSRSTEGDKAIEDYDYTMGPVLSLFVLQASCAICRSVTVNSRFVVQHWRMVLASL